jgi:hypothetical protein
MDARSIGHPVGRPHDGTGALLAQTLTANLSDFLAAAARDEL